MNFQRPRGTVDIYDKDAIKWNKLIGFLREIAFLYNYKEIITPMFESSDVFKRGVGETTDIVTKEMYNFTDKKGRELTLRPEGTAPAIRAIIENKLYAVNDLALKYFYLGPMFRYERPQSGRQRQFHQFGVEAIGNKNVFLDIEMVLMAHQVLRFLNIHNVVLKINNLGSKATTTKYRDELKKHIGKNKDSLCEDCQNRVDNNPLRVLDCKVDSANELLKSIPSIEQFWSAEETEYFNEIKSTLKSIGVNFEFDNKLVRGLDYYNDLVFEYVILDKIEKTQNTVIAGGRYNNLIKEMGGNELSGIGFAIGLERLVSLWKDTTEDRNIDIYVIALSKAAEKLAQAIMFNLRSKGFACDMDYENRKISKQFSLAAKQKAHHTILIGDKEIESKYILVKEEATRKEDKVPFVNMDAYFDKMERGN